MHGEIRPYLERLEVLFPVLFRRLETRSRGAKGDLSIVQRMVLAILMGKEQTTMSELSSALGITKGAATTLVDRLVEDGLASRARSESDRRLVYVQLTEKGRLALQESKRQRLKALGEYLALLEDEEVDALVRILEKLAGVMGPEGLKGQG